MNNKGLKVLFSIGLLAVASVVGFFAYTSLYQNAPEIETPPAEEVKESTSSVAIDKASTLFHQERDYEAAIVVLEDTLKNLEAEKSDTDDYLKEESKVKLQLASNLLRNDQIKAFALYAEIYNNQAYPNPRRADAIIDVMWHVTSHLGDGTLTLEQVKNDILAPERFGSLVGLTVADVSSVTSSIDAQEIAGQMFGAAADLTDSQVSAALANSLYLKSRASSLTYSQLFAGVMINGRSLQESEQNGSIGRDDVLSTRGLLAETIAETGNPINNLPRLVANSPAVAAEYQRLLQEANELLVTLDTLRAETDQFEPELMASYFHLHYVLRYLASAGFDTTDLLRQVVVTIDTYIRTDPLQSFLNNIALAEASITLACQLVAQAGNVVNYSDASEVKRLLANLYNLPPEDLERRYGLRAISSNQLHYCHEPYKRIGREVDPRFAEVLVNTVGGWQEADFQ